MNRYLVKADISGIQNYIFDTTSKKASQNLKARSFYIYVLTHIIEEYLKREFQVEEVIYNGGGNLLICLKAEESVISIKTKELQHNFLTKDVYIHFSWVLYDDDNFKEKNRAVNQLLAKNKLSKNIYPTTFQVTADNIGSENIVKQLINADGFSIIPGETPKGISLVGFSVSFSNAEKSFKNNMINKLPMKDNHTVIDFDSIADSAVMRNADSKLAALKLDVDNLGAVFKNKEKTDYKKLSTGIDVFFSRTLYEKALKKYIDSGDIYPVFAGGDDCFLIGAWDVIFDIAGKIQQLFARAQAEIRSTLTEKEENDITISAGIVVVNAKFPMIRLAEEAENALDLSKTNGKNRITVFGEPLTWQEFESAKDIAYQLSELVVKGESRALIQRVKSSDLGYKSLQNTAVNRGKIEIPKVHRLKYYLRNVKNKENLPVIEGIFNDYTNSLLQDFMHSSTTNNALKYPIAARWAELLTKNLKS
ncbi:Cas10/Cmr2 second palm domain-containing protein [Proteiniphilum propionicum]|jgi:CRISPR-associated protein Csm1|uniref:Cas10/Cmr2 second palm domain-containing protein n=1 Tax=Proteiniphilum propionicum TaxID=2829812 RepID=UPI001EEB815D|nr:hypothetical protein [Proteiniphilum propionicum]ULB35856.1 hypothetical protein KDN43_07550 [Proteiniphilum propionicum]